MDWNNHSHALKCKIDVLLLIRWLLGCLKTWGILNQWDPIVTQEPHLIPIQEVEEVIHPQDILTVFITIDNGMRIRNPVNKDLPANSYVIFKPDFPVLYNNDH